MVSIRRIAANFWVESQQLFTFVVKSRLKSTKSKISQSVSKASVEDSGSVVDCIDQPDLQ